MKTVSLALRAFSLPKYLVIIAGAVVLLGLLLPPRMRGIGHPTNAQARNDLQQIVAAVKMYRAEYGYLPQLVTPTASEPGEDVLVGDPSAGAKIDNSALMDTLRAIDRGPNAGHALNPRKIVFFEAKIVRDATAPRGGILEDTRSPMRGCFFDPWGKQYCIILDANSDNTLDLAAQYSDFAGENAPRASVGGFAMGKDGMLGTKGDGKFRIGKAISDDVITWR